MAVTIHYVEPLAYADGGYELVFPMVAGAAPRAGGVGELTHAAAVLPAGQRSGHDIALAVDLDAGRADRRSSSRRRTASSDRGDRTSEIAADDTIPNKDFVLRYQVAGPR